MLLLTLRALQTDMKAVKNWTLWGVIGMVFFITAWKSDGYYHADEHYQLIEFAGKILGTHQPEELAWEYNARLRPALQPTIAAFFGFIKCHPTQRSLSAVVHSEVVKCLAYHRCNFIFCQIVAK